MPTPSPRPSLDTNLNKRYDTQHEGGAFNAHDIINNGDVNTAVNSQQQAQFCTINGFLTREPIGVSQFKNNGKDLSFFVQGLDTRRYHG